LAIHRNRAGAGATRTLVITRDGLSEPLTPAEAEMVNAFVSAADGQRLDEMVRAVIEIMRRVDRAAVAAGFLDGPFFGEH
jgi:hypothetical protein